MMPPGLVQLREVVPEAQFDLRYTTAHNVAGRPLEQAQVASQLQLNAAQALHEAARLIRQAGYRLVVWDAFRSEAAQAALQAVSADERYVARSSYHCQGLAVDVTLANDRGEKLDMGSDFDDFSDRAHVDFNGLSESQRANRQLLQTSFEAAGFTQWPYEWWHFNFLAE